MIDVVGPGDRRVLLLDRDRGGHPDQQPRMADHRARVGRSAGLPCAHLRRGRPRVGCPARAGLIYGEAPPGGTFTYHKDPGKTPGACIPSTATGSTVGDVGYLDAEGYLFLTDRKSFMIISGGVNIYPQQIEDALALHPKGQRRCRDRRAGRGTGRGGQGRGRARAGRDHRARASARRSTTCGTGSPTTRRPAASTSPTRCPERPPASWSSAGSASSTSRPRTRAAPRGGCEAGRAAPGRAPAPPRRETGRRRGRGRRPRAR